MHICYLDESGAPEPAGTSHFVVLGLAIPVTAWKKRDADLAAIKVKHRLSGMITAATNSVTARPIP
jgi:hypothetical protein